MRPPDRCELRARRIELARSTERLVRRLADGDVLAPRWGWRRHFGRYHGDLPTWATVVLEHDTGAVAHLSFHGERPDGTAFALGPEGFVGVSFLRDDASLPGLGATIDALDDPCILRYRPGLRCTLRGSVDGLPRVVKVTDDAARIDAIARVLWSSADGGRLGFTVAPPLGVEADLGAVHLGVVPGLPIVTDVLGAAGPEWSHRVGLALGSLAATGAGQGRAMDASDQAARSARGAARAAQAAPDLAPGLRVVLDELATRQASLIRRDPVPVHGSPHPGQWLATHDGLGLIDFDRFGWGDPEHDLAAYLAELDYERRLTCAIDLHEAAIVAGFEEAHRPVDMHRLWLYRMHKRLAKVTRTACALRADAADRAALHLAALRRDLAV